MLIVWDERKRLANLEKHGLDFEAFETDFDFETYIAADARPSRTGRHRRVLIGTFGRTLIVVAVVSPLGSEAVSLVSLRPASPRERNLFHGT